MEYNFSHQPSYTLVTAQMDADEQLTVEGGSMVSYTQHVDMDTHSSGGGILSSVKKSVLSSEQLFRNTFTATADGQGVSFAHTQPGDMAMLELDDQTVHVQSGSYVANTPGIETDVTSGGLNSMLGGKGLFFLEATGTGDLFIGSYGGIIEKELAEGEQLTIDTGHSVAWDDTVDFDTHRVGGLKSTMFSGEGLVMTFTGPGRVFLQTRDYDSFLAEIASRVTTSD